MCVYPSCTGPGFWFRFHIFQTGRGDLQSSARWSSLRASQETRIDHPWVPALNQVELLISVPCQCAAFWFSCGYRWCLVGHACTAFPHYPCWRCRFLGIPPLSLVFRKVTPLVLWVCLSLRKPLITSFKVGLLPFWVRLTLITGSCLPVLPRNWRVLSRWLRSFWTCVSWLSHPQHAGYHHCR